MRKDSRKNKTIHAKDYLLWLTSPESRNVLNIYAYDDNNLFGETDEAKLRFARDVYNWLRPVYLTLIYAHIGKVEV